MLVVHLFVCYAHVSLCHFSSSSWCRGMAAASACGSSWTFLFTFKSSPAFEELSGTVVSRLDYCAGYPGSIPAAAEFPTGI